MYPTMTETAIYLGGRTVDVHDVLRFLYNLSESDVRVLHYLSDNYGKKMTIEEIGEALKISKASVSKSLKNLLEKGLVKREKEMDEENRKGRPNYLYWVDIDELYEKAIDDLKELIEKFKEDLKNHLMSARAQGAQVAR